MFNLAARVGGGGQVFSGPPSSGMSGNEIRLRDEKLLLKPELIRILWSFMKIFADGLAGARAPFTVVFGIAQKFFPGGLKFIKFIDFVVNQSLQPRPHPLSSPPNPNSHQVVQPDACSVQVQTIPIRFAAAERGQMISVCACVGGGGNGGRGGVVPPRWRRDEQTNNSLFCLRLSEKEERLNADINIHADNQTQNVATSS